MSTAAQLAADAEAFEKAGTPSLISASLTTPTQGSTKQGTIHNVY